MNLALPVSYNRCNHANVHNTLSFAGTQIFKACLYESYLRPLMHGTWLYQLASAARVQVVHLFTTKLALFQPHIDNQYHCFAASSNTDCGGA